MKINCSHRSGTAGGNTPRGLLNVIHVVVCQIAGLFKKGSGIDCCRSKRGRKGSRKRKKIFSHNSPVGSILFVPRSIQA